MLDVAPRTRLIGESGGDRFANRVDVEAAVERGVRVVDTTHGSSLPVAEWALGLMLIGLRNAGEQFRRLTRGDEFRRCGAIVDPDALIARARRGDIRVAIEVFDPEPIPAGSPIR